jgi:ribosome-associated toxin RatA of RatAB toxin-antitoxin module
VAEQTSSSVLVDAPPARVMGVIADFPRYPEWAQGVHACEVRETRPDGRAREVYFELEATPIRDSYTLVYEWHGDEAVTWALGSGGRMLRRLDGAYRLAPTGNATEVTYDLAVELGIPMIGMLRRKAEKVIIDTALRGLKKRVEGSR